MGQFAQRTLVLLELLLAALSLTSCGETSIDEEPPEAIGPNQPPAVQIVGPTDELQKRAGETFEILVAAEDSDGDELELIVAVDGKELSREKGLGGEMEHSSTFTPSMAGTYTVTAMISDPAGASATASAVVHAWSGLQESFSLVAIPDTQNMIRYPANTMVDEMVDWVLDSAAERKIAFLSQEGDLVDEGSDGEEWKRIDRAMSKLDGRLPYSVALGDHEYHVEENFASSTVNYVAYFGPDRYREYDWYGGSGPGGKSHYQLFEAGGRHFLHLALEWEAPGPASDPGTPLGWARGILEKHQDLPTIITTHAYLWDYPGYEGRTWKPSHLQGYVEDENGERSYPGSTGQDIFESLVEPFTQVFMVLNGHYHKGSGEANGEYHQMSLNSAGLEVFEMLANYQDYPNGGDGWLRLIEFMPGGGEGDLDRIAVQTYSPVLDDYQTDANSRFHFDLDFEARFDSADPN